MSRAAHPTTTRRRVLAGLVPSVLGIGLAAVLTGCGAGQITQTDTQLAGVNGASGNAGPIAIRDAQLAFPTDNTQGVYAPGTSADLVLTIVNTGLTDDTLVKVDTPAALGVLIDGSATGSAPLPGNFAVSSGQDPDDGTLVQPGSTSSDASPAISSPSSGSPASGSPASGSPSSAAAPTGGASSAVAPPAALTPGTVTIELVGIKSINGGSLRAGMTIPITFYFAHAGQVTLGQVPIGAPADDTVVATPSDSNG